MALRLEIKGMHCKSCKMVIEDVLEDLGVKVVSFDLDEGSQTGVLELQTDKTSKEISDAIKAEGEYTIKILK